MKPLQPQTFALFMVGGALLVGSLAYWLSRSLTVAWQWIATVFVVLLLFGVLVKQLLEAGPRTKGK